MARRYVYVPRWENIHSTWIVTVQRPIGCWPVSSPLFPLLIFHALLPPRIRPTYTEIATSGGPNSDVIQPRKTHFMKDYSQREDPPAIAYTARSLGSSMILSSYPAVRRSIIGWGKAAIKAVVRAFFLWAEKHGAAIEKRKTRVLCQLRLPGLPVVVSLTSAQIYGTTSCEDPQSK